jgi:hypothetical protein
MKTCLGILGVVAAIAVAAAVSGWWYFGGALFEDERRLSVAHVKGARLDVEASNGSVKAEVGGTDQVEIVAVVKAASEERLAATQVVAERGEDDGLFLRVVWPDGMRKAREGCKFSVVTPGADGVRLKSSNGSVTLTGLDGLADLKTSNGSITLSGHTGNVVAETSNGSVTIREATGQVKAKSSNGKVKVELAPVSAGPVDVKNSNGSVEVIVGAGFMGTVKTKTSNGSVKLEGLEAVTMVNDSKKQKEFVVGGAAAPVSTVNTSNGSVRVKLRAGGGEAVEKVEAGENLKVEQE